MGYKTKSNKEQTRQTKNSDTDNDLVPTTEKGERGVSKSKGDDVEGMHSEAGVKMLLTISRSVGNNIFKYSTPFLIFIRIILSLQRRCVVQRICET